MKTYWIIWLAIGLHLIQGSMLILDPSVGDVNSLHFLLRFFPSARIAGFHLLTVAALALIERIRAYGRIPKLGHLLLLLPQQFILLITTGGVFEALINGRFSNTLVATSPFIIASQCPIIITTILYCLAIIEVYIPERLPWTTSARI